MKGLITIWILVIISGIGAFGVFNYLTQPAGAVTCTGPCNQMTEHDDEPLQHVTDTTGCPYGDSIPMSDCDRYAPQPTPQPQVLGTQTEQPTIDYYYGGK